MEHYFNIKDSAEGTLYAIANLVLLVGLLLGIIVIIATSDGYTHGDFTSDEIRNIGLVIGISTMIGSIITYAFLHVVVNISNNLKNINKILSEKEERTKSQSTH